MWGGKRVLVTGGAGFIGAAVVNVLRARGVATRDIVIPRMADCDLRVVENARRAVQGCDVVIHLAAPTGGIAFSNAHPATQYAAASLINLNVFEAAREADVAKFVAVGNLLVYPAVALMPLHEDRVFDGPIAPTHLGIGQVKRDQLLMGEMYHREFGMPAVNVLSANAYGPGDRFDPGHSHVIPATILKCFLDEDLVVWGDGAPTRDFLYVDDVAEGIVLAAEHLESAAPVNLASGNEISIRTLVELIAELTGFRRNIVYDTTKVGGDARRVASTERAERLLGFVPKVSMREGLARTIAAYRASRQ
ncbi:MAG: GDP-L-fucose synthase [Gemmatimonadetes bacterium]|nr:GDP-L-fucose synthase [Gemmatimonadota bacterium]